MERPLIGITIGDPAGIGPEISWKALQNKDLYDRCRPLLIGSAKVLSKVKGADAARIRAIQAPNEGSYTFGTVDVLDIDNLDVDKLQMGVVQEACGHACYAYIERSATLAMNGDIDAVVTAPINKEAIKAAGIPHIGHTEMFAAFTGATREMTMFSIENVKIFFLTRHMSVADACRKIDNNPDFVLKGIRQAWDALKTLISGEPRLAVAALNPHGGEGGLLGQEEINSIRPAVERAKAEGMNVSGPIPADSVFHLARRGQYDAVLSLYHDQGHIAAKMMDFHKTVSVTLGLPILRTSVDHGTAYDIAGQGIASEISMSEAILAAADYAVQYSARAGAAKA